MTKTYVKNDPVYDDVSEFEEQKISEALKKRARKTPTSVALDPELVAQIKKLAVEKGVPYQVLLRMYIIEGFKRMEKSSA